MIKQIKRFGTEYGGFFYPNHLDGLDKDSIIYCVGAGLDISHDVIISGLLKSKVFIIDPTPASIEHVAFVKECLDSNNYEPLHNVPKFGGGHMNYAKLIADSECSSENLIMIPYALGTKDSYNEKFYKPSNPGFVSHSLREGMKSNEYFHVQVKSISSIMKELDHTYIDLLKLDIEGLECDVLEDLITNSIFPKYLSIDFDGYHKDKDRVHEIYNRLKDIGYEKILREGNEISLMNTNKIN